jgi:hypothetical protein
MSLFPEAIGNATGDPLDRFYTPQAIADECFARLLAHPLVGLDLWGLWCEPSCGGGAFIRSMQRHAGCIDQRNRPRIVGVDIDPNAAGLALADEAIVGDWLDAILLPTVIAGNPPFSQALAHVRASVQTRAHVGLILPVELMCTQGGAELLEEYPITELHPITGRPWPKSVRGCAFYVWRPVGRHILGPPIRWSR